MKNFLIGLGLIFFIGFIFWAGRNFDTEIINVAGHNLNIWVADDPAEQAHGLSGKKSMSQNRGMLFVLAIKNTTPFWMKGMKFPLDFIWIDSGTIVGITPNVQPCEDSNNCSQIIPSAPVNYVLEVNSGWAATNNIAVGQTITGLPE